MACGNYVLVSTQLDYDLDGRPERTNRNMDELFFCYRRLGAFALDDGYLFGGVVSA